MLPLKSLTADECVFAGLKAINSHNWLLVRSPCEAGEYLFNRTKVLKVMRQPHPARWHCACVKHALSLVFMGLLTRSCSSRRVYVVPDSNSAAHRRSASFRRVSPTNPVCMTPRPTACTHAQLLHVFFRRLGGGGVRIWNNTRGATRGRRWRPHRRTLALCAAARSIGHACKLCCPCPVEFRLQFCAMVA